MTIPTGWEEARIADIAIEIRSSVTPVDGERYELWSVPSYATGGPEILDGSEIGSAKLKVQPWDVLVCKINPRINRVWIVRESSSNLPQIASPEWLVLRFPLSIRPVAASFFAGYLTGPKFRHWITGAVSGVTGSHTRAKSKEILQQKVPIAPLAEQQRIVAATSASLDRLSAGCAGLKRSYNYSATYRRVVEDRAVLGELITPRWNTSAAAERDLADISENRSLRAKRRRTRSQSPSPFHYEIPSHWVVASVDQLCWDIEYGTSVKTRDEAGPASTPVLRMGNIQQSRIVMNNLKYLPTDSRDIASLMLEDGDLLFNRTNSAELVGKSAVFRKDTGPATFASYLIRCRFASGVNPDWVNLVINSSIGRHYIASVASQQVGQANVNGTKLARMPIPFPPLSEQDDILAAVAEHELLIGRLRESIRISLKRAESLRESVLLAAFAGQLVPQDPQDEAASVLLEHVKAARLAANETGVRRAPAVQGRSSLE